MAGEMGIPSETESSIQDFQYPSSGLPASSNWQSIASIASDPYAATRGTDRAADPAGALETEGWVEEGRRKGIEEGRRIERLEQAQRIEELEKRRIEQAARLSEQVAQERDNFLHAVEPEVVRLALRIAQRILAREVQVDPLSLTGAVRIALGQLADQTAVRVRVPANDATLWTETLERLPNLRTRPTVVADEKLEPGECQLETECGSADLSIQSQLREISQAIFGGSIELERKTSSMSRDTGVVL